MYALTVEPGRPNSLTLSSIDMPSRKEDYLLVKCLNIGVCGTDIDILSGKYGSAPAGEHRLVIGHESLGVVLEAPIKANFQPGDLVIGFVRRPDPVPCACCAVGDWDMCRNGQYTERGIKGAHGYASEYFTLSPDFALKVGAGLTTTGILLEPASIVAKAWEQSCTISARSPAIMRRVLITGAGPVGLLAALIAIQHGFEVHVFDRAISGAKPALVKDIGATYHSGDLKELTIKPDIVIECTGSATVIVDAFNAMAPVGILCLAGLSSGAQRINLDLAGFGQRLVLGNDVIFGSVNANRRHYRLAAEALANAPRGWLERLITRRVPLANWHEAFERRPDDIKTVIDFAAPPLTTSQADVSPH